MNPRSAKAKGRRLQDQVAKDLAQAFNLSPELIHKSIMGETGVDVMVLGPDAAKTGNLGIECKNQEALSFWPAWKQTRVNAAKAKRQPVLVTTRNNHETLAVLPWKALLDLLTQLRSCCND